MESSHHLLQLPLVRGDKLFPEELWDMIAACTDQATRKNLRLCCKTLSRITTPHLFRTIYFQHNDPKTRLHNTMWSSGIQDHVKRLVMRRGDLMRRLEDSPGDVWSPFPNLTSVDCKLFYDPSGRDIPASTFWYFLTSVEKLEVLEVEDRNYRDLLRTFRCTKGRWNESHWNKLHTVTLSAVVTGASILAFLSYLAPTLRSLHLIDCSITQPGYTWPRIMDQARKVLSLESIRLNNLEDAEDLYLPFGECECEIITKFQQRIYDYLLRTTDDYPEWNETKVIKAHLNRLRTPPAVQHHKECFEQMKTSPKFDDIMDTLNSYP